LWLGDDERGAWADGLRQATRDDGGEYEDGGRTGEASDHRWL
jgi:hypothetical protein